MENEKKKQCFYVINRRIGSTTFRVKVYGSENAEETMEDKILRMIQNTELIDHEKQMMQGSKVTNQKTCDIIKSPQMSRQSEGSAS